MMTQIHVRPPSFTYISRSNYTNEPVKNGCRALSLNLKIYRKVFGGNSLDLSSLGGSNGHSQNGGPTRHIIRFSGSTASTSVDPVMGLYKFINAKHLSNVMTLHAREMVMCAKNLIWPTYVAILMWSGTLVAWDLVSIILERYHNFSSSMEVPYEQSSLEALERLIQFLLACLTYSRLAKMGFGVAELHWRGAYVLAFLLFLQRLNTNKISRAKNVQGIDLQRLVTLDMFTSIGLYLGGIYGYVHPYGVTLQVLTAVCGLGGVVTSFVLADIQRNALSRLSIQVSQPFSLGDTMTHSINRSNPLYPSLIVSEPRVQYRPMTLKIYVQVDELFKIPRITDSIKTMMVSNTNVFVDEARGVPYCWVTGMNDPNIKLTLLCNVKYKGKQEFLFVKDTIRQQAAEIVIKHGGRIGDQV